MKKVLIVSAHPDDEVLGAGGTLARHRDNGDAVAWLIVTNLFEKDGFSKQTVNSRKAEIERVANQLKMQIYNIGYSTINLSYNDLIGMIPKISNVFNEFKPERVYVINRSDAHSDHRVVFDAVMACTKSFRYQFIREVLMYECISETEFAPPLIENSFSPNCFIDISNQMEEKIKLMEIYKSEIGKHPFPRSEHNIRALATFRGATCGVDYAEAFQILKSFRFEEL